VEGETVSHITLKLYGRKTLRATERTSLFLIALKLKGVPFRTVSAMV
jgi:hypothetical protein